jgi:predicted AlkP superfamily pyrophosphatase or phosphodiesterase
MTRSKLSPLLLVCLYTSVFPARATWAAAPVAAKDRTVILISLDGFPAYDLEDPKLPIPMLRELMRNGSWAKSMQPINPTWTWPNHTTMVTGVDARKHGVLYNGILRRQDDPLGVKVDPTAPKVQMVHVPTVYDLAQQSGLTTAQVDWVAINDAPTITWAFPEKAAASDALVKEMVGKGVLTLEDISNDGQPSIVWRDQIWARAGSYLIKEHKPNLLLFHLLTLDSTHHTYAPRTLASYDAIAFLDSCIRELIEATKTAGIFEQTTFLVVSDHGFRRVEKQIWLRNVLNDAHIGPEVQVIPEGGSGMIYVSSGNRKELVEKVAATLAGTEGVARVVKESDFSALGYPLPSSNRQMPDVVVLAKPGYAMAGERKGAGPVVAATDSPVGAHGYLNTDPEMQAIFVASGYGVKKGQRLDTLRNTRVAPTVAALLGLKLPDGDSPISEALQQ